MGGGAIKKKSRINSKTKFIILLLRKLKRSYPIKTTNNDEKLPHM